MIMENFLDGTVSESKYETSADEYIPSSESDDSEEEIEATLKRRRKPNRNRQKHPPTDSSEDDEEDMPLARIRHQLYDSDDDVPIADLRERCRQTVVSHMLDDPFWEGEDFFPSDSSFKGTLELHPEDGHLKEPTEYFKDIITDKMIENMEVQTNMYSMQDGMPVKTTVREISLLIGIYLLMGLVAAHSVKAYWAAETKYPPGCRPLSQNRFQKLFTSLHVTDNSNISEEDKRDKLWKLRPWLEDLKDSLKKIPQEEHSAVDEVMIPFKGKSVVKQYIRNKPQKWGFKVWGTAGVSRMLYEFEVYQGASAKGKEHFPLGMTGEVVMRLTSNLPVGINYKVFADNLFTSLALVEQLNKKAILYVGTVRLNRLKGCKAEG